MRKIIHSPDFTSFPYFYLSLHGDAEQRDKVHDQDRPEHGDVEKLEEGAEEGDDGGLRGRVPELELRQPPDERAELFVLPRRQLEAVVVVSLELG